MTLHPLFTLQNFHIFDLDGTILDSFPVVADIFAEVTAPYGVPADAAKAVLYANTHERILVLLPRLFRECGIPVRQEDIDATYADFQRRFEDSEADFFPDAIDTLRRAKDRGCTLFLSSLSSDSLVERRLRHGGIEKGVFAMHLGSTRLLKGEAHVRAFAEHLGLEPRAFTSRAVLWGDTGFDMQMATDHGLFGVGVIGTLTKEELKKAGATTTVPAIAPLRRSPVRP